MLSVATMRIYSRRTSVLLWIKQNYTWIYVGSLLIFYCNIAQKGYVVHKYLLRDLLAINYVWIQICVVCLFKSTTLEIGILYTNFIRNVGLQFLDTNLALSTG